MLGVNSSTMGANNNPIRDNYLKLNRGCNMVQGKLNMRPTLNFCSYFHIKLMKLAIHEVIMLRQLPLKLHNYLLSSELRDILLLPVYEHFSPFSQEFTGCRSFIPIFWPHAHNTWWPLSDGLEARILYLPVLSQIIWRSNRWRIIEI